MVAARARPLPARSVVLVADRGRRAGARHRARAPASRPWWSIRTASLAEAHEKAVDRGAASERAASGSCACAGYMRLLTPALRARTSRAASSTSTPRCCPRSRACTPSGRRSSTACGCGRTVHFVDEGVDSGPDRAAGRGAGARRTTPRRRLAARILVEEHRLYPEAVRLFARGRLEIHGAPRDASGRRHDAVRRALISVHDKTGRGGLRAGPGRARRRDPLHRRHRQAAARLRRSRWWTSPRSPASPRCSTGG